MAGNDGAGARKPYKRSWKNLLINKQYQLRFTLFMVGLSAVLISALGWWVMRVASEATNVAIGQVQGDSCPPIPSIAGDGEAGGATLPAAPVGSAAVAPGAAGSGEVEPAEPADPDAEDSARRRRVVIDDSSMTITQVLPDGYADAVAAHWTCELEQSAAIGDLEAGRRQILYVMIGTGLLLVVALAIYGIMTTHKVAGPLHKVTLYFAKMRDGRLDKVWPLRKGDQLVAFYDHFRAAHAGVVELEHADIAAIRAVLDAARAAGVAGTSPEIDAALAELTALVERKEKALV